MKELILGGEGLIGRSLAQALRDRGHQVFSLDIKSGCDLRYADDTTFISSDRVWFLAWDTGGTKYIEAADRQHEIYKHNCELSARVFDVLERLRLPFLFTTSQLAGQPNAYGLTKLMAERRAMQLGGKIARLWNIFGWETPGQKSHVITDLVLSGLLKGRVRCHTTGRERRRFLYRSDCVSALIALADSAQQTADIAGIEWLTIQQAAEEIARQLEVDVGFGEVEGAEVMIDPEHLLMDWQPTVSFSEGISKVINEARLFLKR